MYRFSLKYYKKIRVQEYILLSYSGVLVRKYIYIRKYCVRVCLFFKHAATVYIVLCVYVTSMIPSDFTLMRWQCSNGYTDNYTRITRNSPLQTDRSQKYNTQGYSGITAESAARQGGSSCVRKQEQGRNEEKNIRKLSVLVCKIQNF